MYFTSKIKKGVRLKAKRPKVSGAHFPLKVLPRPFEKIVRALIAPLLFSLALSLAAFIFPKAPVAP